MRSKILFFDTETTGLNPGDICQLSYIISDDEDIQAKNFFFAVDYVEPGAQRIHGLSVEKLKKLSYNKRFIDSFSEIKDDFNSVNIIAEHNISFDIRFIKSEFNNCKYNYDYDESFCTMRNFTSTCKIPKPKGSGYKWPTLEELIDYFGVKHTDILKTSKELFKCNDIGFHDARYDIVATYLCYMKADSRGLVRQLAYY